MTLEMKELEAAVEGILFASGEPVHIDRICLALDIDRLSAEQILQRLSDYYAYERRGVRLVRMEDTWQMCSSPDYGDIIRKAFEIRKSAKLSQPALEVLSIIAYYQPTTRAYVDQIRGVDSAYTVGLLLGGCRCRAGPGSTAPQRISSGRFTLPAWRICRICRAWRPRGSCVWGTMGFCWTAVSRQGRKLRKRVLPRRHNSISERQRGACKAWCGSLSWA